MPPAEHAEVNQFPGRRFLVGDARQTREDKHHRNDNQQYGQRRIRCFHQLSLGIDVCLPSPGIVGGKRLAGIGLSAEYQLAEEHRGHECAQSVERLREVQSARGRRRVAERRNIRVGGRLEEAHPRGYNEEHTEIEPVLLNHCRRKKEQCTRSRRQQPEHDALLVAIALHEHGYRNRADKVGKPVGRFGERCLEGGKLARLHQLPYHRGQQVGAYRPQEKQAEYERQRH